MEGSRLRALLTILGICIAVALIAGLLNRGSEIDERATADPEAPAEPTAEARVAATPTATVEAPSSLPTPMVIPERNRRWLRAGEPCTVVEPGTGREAATFVIPSGMATEDCRNLSWSSAVGEAVLTVTLEAGGSLEPFFPEPAEVGGQVAFNYRPLRDAVAWRVRQQEWSAPELPTVALVAVSGNPSEPGGPQRDSVIVVSAQPDGTPLDIEQATEQLVATIDLDYEPWRTPPQQGGVCAGDNWTFPVPANWFAAHDCRTLSTSSEAELGQCACPGEIMVREGALEPLEDPILTAAGLRYTVVEEEREGDVLPSGRYRTVTIELPDRLLVIEATAQPDFGLPTQTWSASTSAQDRIVRSVRTHSTGCADEGGEEYVLRNPVGTWTGLGLGGHTIDGALVRSTGCRDGDRIEVQSQAAGAVGFVERANLEPRTPTDCAGTALSETDLTASELVGAWPNERSADLDGDGAADRVFLREAVGETNSPAGVELAVAFAHGSTVVAALDARPGFAHVVGDPAVIRPIGLDHDVLVVWEPNDRVGENLLLVDVASCEPRVIGSFERLWGRSGTAKDICVEPTAFGDVVIAWRTEATTQPGRTGRPALADKTAYRWDDGTFVELAPFDLVRLGIVHPLCGPADGPTVLPVNPDPERSGEHYDLEVTVGDRPPVTAAVELIPATNGRFLVNDSFRDDDGRPIALQGVLTPLGSSLLEFDGALSVASENAPRCDTQGKPAFVFDEPSWNLVLPECDDASIRLTPASERNDCDAAAGDPTTEWLAILDADVDGDGATDTVRVRPSEVLVVDRRVIFEAEVDLDGIVRRVGLPRSIVVGRTDSLELRRFPAPGSDGRDLVLLISGPTRAWLLDFGRCEPTVLASLPSRAGLFSNAAWCRVDGRTPEVIRRYVIGTDFVQGSVLRADEHLEWDGRELIVSDVLGEPPVCGSETAPPLPPVDPGEPGTELAGEYRVTALWGDGSTISRVERFQPLGTDRYSIAGFGDFENGDMWVPMRDPGDRDVRVVGVAIVEADGPFTWRNGDVALRHFDRQNQCGSQDSLAPDGLGGWRIELPECDAVVTITPVD